MTDQTSIDHTLPGEKWAFDAGVTDVFENMLARSIPQYEVMRGSVTDVGMIYRQRATSIIDLGCSRGDALAPFIERYGAENTYYGVDVSAPMLATARDRFGRHAHISIGRCDLRTDYPVVFTPASVTLAVLTLQFIPIEYRQRVLRHIYEDTAPGGCAIVVEKVLGADADMDDLMRTLYYRQKADHGYSVEEIERKRLSLEGVLVPQTAATNVEWLRAAGFRSVDCFWRWMNFAGWVALR